MNKEELINKLNSLLNELNIPENNRDLNNPRNVLWLLRNLGIDIKNRNSENFEEILELLKQLRKLL